MVSFWDVLQGRRYKLTFFLLGPKKSICFGGREMTVAAWNVGEVFVEAQVVVISKKHSFIHCVPNKANFEWVFDNFPKNN